MKGRIVILKIESKEKDAGTVALNIFEHCYLPGYDSRSFRDDGIFVTLDEIDNSALAEFRTHGKYVYNVATGREIKCKHFKKEIIDKIKAEVVKGNGFHDVYTVEVGPVSITYMFDVWAWRNVGIKEFKALNLHDKRKIFDFVVDER